MSRPNLLRERSGKSGANPKRPKPRPKPKGFKLNMTKREKPMESKQVSG
jgi:hypothetical protein